MTAPTHLEPWNDPALEVRVVAYVLGEVSAFEAAEVARMLEEIPELAAFARRIEAVHGLLAEDARPLAGGEWKLSPERRDKVLAAIGMPATAMPDFHAMARESKQMKRRRWRRNLLLLAASVAFGILVVNGMFSTLGIKSEPTESGWLAASAPLDGVIKERESRRRQVEHTDSDQEMVPLQPTVPQDLRVGTPKDLSKSLAEHEAKRQQMLADSGGGRGEWQRRLEEKPSSDLAALSMGGSASKDQPFTVRATGDDGRTDADGRRSTDTLITRGAIDRELAKQVPADALSMREDVANNSFYRGKGQAGAGGSGGAEAKPDGFAYTGGVELDHGLAPDVAEFEGFVNYGQPIADGKDKANGGVAAAARPARPIVVAGAKSPGDETATFNGGGQKATLVAGTEITLDAPAKPGEPAAATTSATAATGEALAATDEINGKLLAGGIAGDKGKKLEELSGRWAGRTDSELAEATKPTGDRSRITVQRESIAPTEYEPPEPSNSLVAATDGSAAFPVTPATPTAFAVDAMGQVAPTEYAPPELPGSAGLSKRDVVADHSSPVLGDLPVVGGLFQSKDQSLWADNSEVERPKQVRMETKHVEIAQANTKELGFDWLVADEGEKEGGVEQQQEERLRQASAKLEKARQEFESMDIAGLNQPSGGRGDEVDDGSASLIMRGKVSVPDLTKDVEKLRAQTAALKSLEGDALVRKAAMLGIEAPTIAKYYPQFNELVLREKQAADSGLGADHPERRGIRSQRETVQNLLTAATRDVRESLDIKLQQAEKKLGAARNSEETEESEVLLKNQKLIAYEQAKAEYNAQKAIVTKQAEIAQAMDKANDQIDGKKKEAEVKANMAARPPAPPPPLVTIETSDTRVDPVSTFSLNVSDVSFRLGARALLAESKLPEPASVRTEDYVNALDYGDALPARGEAVTAVVQQAAQPFVPGRNLVRVGLRTAESGRANGQPLSLTILLDQSGSMERPDRAAAVRKTMADLAGLLQADDVVTVIGFARTPRLLVDRLPGQRAAELAALVLQAPPQGGTNLEAAFDLAAQAAARQFKAAAGNRVVLITDGAANLGQIDPQALSARVEGWRRAHIAFDACGVGTAGVDDTMLEALARKGDGRYLVVAEDTDVSLAKELAGAFRPAARNVKVQVRFNPDRVGKFHLLGFEKHRLAEQDFRDDTVDAAELAAAEQGNALYQVELLPGGSGEIGDVAVRFQDTATGKMVERHWTIPYDANTPTLDRAAPPMQLAATAGLLAEALKGSPLGNLVRLKDLRAQTLPMRGAFPGDEAVATLLKMVDKASSLKGE